MRVRRLFVVTLIATSVFIALFFIGYFHLLRHPAYPLIVMPLTALDRLLPFQPHALFAYLSLWVYVGFGPGLQRTYTDLFVYGLWMGALCLTGLTLLYFWPTAVPPLGLDVSDLPGIALLRRVDAVGNACPSMHVAAATFTAIRVHEVLRRAHSPLWLRMLNWTWCVAIVYSTLALRQHVVLDVVAGALLGVAFVWPSIGLTTRYASRGGVSSPLAAPRSP
jgi:membrane-associated phospholipid phosphatase